jgi:nicotinamide-nucleotide amidase
MIKAELITIGDELLYGHTIDTNAAFLGEKLAEAGIDIIYHTTVADNAEYILNAIAVALNRANMVITTGGLGPTHDDITKKVICKYFKRQLVFHEDVLKELVEKYERIGIKMPPINQNQALLPQGAKFLENKIGSALGIVIEEHGKIFVAMPGVPKEMTLMVTDQLLPMIKEKTGELNIIHRRLRTVGIVESEIFEKVKDLIDEKSSVNIAFLPRARGVDLRLTYRGGDESKGREVVAEMERKFTERIGDYIFGHDDDLLTEAIGKLLKESQKTIAVAESCTGGFLGKILTDIPGSSEYFLGGVTAYSNELKTRLLNVPPITLERHGAVSEETAKHMAEGVKNLAGASIGISITGIAGPAGGSEDKPVGLVYIGLATPESTLAKRFTFGPVRERVRTRAAFYALDIVRRYLKGIQ